mmetsp:Transcript_12957/g.31204  ORF Transcript_12957/g.31204 Transcript_12957/m.31204 type:complete len:302 (+) Transcript_12957:360-1265(+)
MPVAVGELEHRVGSLARAQRACLVAVQAGSRHAAPCIILAAGKSARAEPPCRSHNSLGLASALVNQRHLLVVHLVDNVLRGVYAVQTPALQLIDVVLQARQQALVNTVAPPVDLSPTHEGNSVLHALPALLGDLRGVLSEAMQGRCLGIQASWNEAILLKLGLEISQRLLLLPAQSLNITMTRVLSRILLLQLLDHILMEDIVHVTQQVRDHSVTNGRPARSLYHGPRHEELREIVNTCGRLGLEARVRAVLPGAPEKRLGRPVDGLELDFYLATIWAGARKIEHLGLGHRIVCNGHSPHD